MNCWNLLRFWTAAGGRFGFEHEQFGGRELES
jgi:hypothetical protein